MTKTAPPENARWHHYEMYGGLGKDSTVSPIAQQTREDWKRLRLEWLDQFDLIVTEEGPYRWWRWYDRLKICRWSERRSISDSLPRTPGLWPRND